jgi:hypothetical protein
MRCRSRHQPPRTACIAEDVAARQACNRVHFTEAIACAILPPGEHPSFTRLTVVRYRVLRPHHIPGKAGQISGGAQPREDYQGAGQGLSTAAAAHRTAPSPEPAPRPRQDHHEYNKRPCAAKVGRQAGRRPSQGQGFRAMFPLLRFSDPRRARTSSTTGAAGT